MTYTLLNPYLNLIMKKNYTPSTATVLLLQQHKVYFLAATPFSSNIPPPPTLAL
jgi:hypothetical protein